MIKLTLDEKAESLHEMFGIKEKRAGEMFKEYRKIRDECVEDHEAGNIKGDVVGLTIIETLKNIPKNDDELVFLSIIAGFNFGELGEKVKHEEAMEQLAKHLFKDLKKTMKPNKSKINN